jgi:hypothetical protein
MPARPSKRLNELKQIGVSFRANWTRSLHPHETCHSGAQNRSLCVLGSCLGDGVGRRGRMPPPLVADEMGDMDPMRVSYAERV